MMYANVIAGVDGRQGGRDAAALAGVVAGAHAVVSLAYVAVPVGKVPGLELEFAADEDLPRLLASELELCGGGAQIHRLWAPSAGVGLERLATAGDADVIVVGACHRHGLSRLFSGDDVGSLLRRTPGAVAAAVAPAGYAEHRVPLRRIGVAYDDSPPSEVALAHAGVLASERGAELVLRHVIEPEYQPVAHGLAPSARDDELAMARTRPSPVDGLTVELIEGSMRDVTDQLTAGVDLLVCGSRHFGSIRRIATGSASEQLARDADIPVVIAPATDPATIERWRQQAHTGAGRV